MSAKKRIYRRYTEEFKRDAVRLIETENLPVAQVARDLDVNVNSLYKWVRDKEVPEDDAPTEDEREELLRLRKEVRVLKEEREILKKATVNSNGQRNGVKSLQINQLNLVEFLNETKKKAWHYLKAS